MSKAKQIQSKWYWRASLSAIRPDPNEDSWRSWGIIPGQNSIISDESKPIELLFMIMRNVAGHAKGMPLNQAEKEASQATLNASELSQKYAKLKLDLSPWAISPDDMALQPWEWQLKVEAMKEHNQGLGVAVQGSRLVQDLI